MSQVAARSPRALRRLGPFVVGSLALATCTVLLSAGATAPAGAQLSPAAPIALASGAPMQTERAELGSPGGDAVRTTTTVRSPVADVPDDVLDGALIARQDVAPFVALGFSWDGAGDRMPHVRILESTGWTEWGQVAFDE